MRTNPHIYEDNPGKLLLDCDLIFNFPENFVIRLNSISLEKNKQTTNIQIRETKVASVKTRQTPYNCLRSEDITDYLAYIKVAQLVRNGVCELTVNLLEEVEFYWSPNFHLKAFHLLRDVARFQDNVKQLIGVGRSEKQKRIETFNLLVYGVFAFHIQISEQHSAKVSLGRNN